MAVNSLGSFDFISIQAFEMGGAPLVPQQAVAVVQRPGVDGTAFVLLGAKGRPFQMLSIRDVASVSAGNVLSVSYQVVSRAIPYQLVFQGNNYDSVGVRYNILAVEQVRIKRVTNAIGGVMGTGANALVSALWTLVPVAWSSPSSGG